MTADKRMFNMKVALNPLQWLATDDGWLDFNRGLPLPTLIGEVRRLGFSAIHTDPPAGMNAHQYGRALADGGLSPAPGYLSAAMEDPSVREEIAGRAAIMAEQHAQLGLTELFVACRMLPTAPRVAQPAIGVEADTQRLGEIARTLARVGEETHKRGVTICLHQHVGTWIETAAEVDWLMDRLDPELVALGPDTGHLAWAGVDPAQIVRRYGSRVKAAHIKDMRREVADRNRGSKSSYREVVAQGLWAEPGSGDIDLDSFVQALGPSFKGWLVVEVDKPSLPTPEASVEASARWARRFGD
jgi:inosose dehydratase